MIVVKYNEDVNGARFVSEHEASTMELLETMTEKQFGAAYPDAYVSGDVAEYLENGVVLLNSEWNGEEYTLANGDRYRPAYRQVDEDNYEYVGYYLV